MSSFENENETLRELLRRGLRLAILYSAAVALLLGSIGIAITLALATPKPAEKTTPATTSTHEGTPHATDSRPPKVHTNVPEGDNPGKPEI